VAADIVYFDLETQKTAGDVGGWDKKADMKMSVGVIYSTALEAYRVFSERQVDELIEHLKQADLVVGFNTINFDYEVLMGYTILDLPSALHSFDMLREVEKVIGHRLSLDSLAQATLGVSKVAEGLDAIRWWREGELMKIAEYCCFDVKVTKMVYEYALQHGELFYADRFGRKQRVETPWGEAQPA